MYPASVENSFSIKAENESICSKSKLHFVGSSLVFKPVLRISRFCESLAKREVTISPFASRSLNRFVMLGQVHEIEWQRDTAGKGISVTSLASTAKRQFIT